MRARVEGWPRDLHAFLLGRAEAGFAWGRNDCFLFAADAILAMTGVDIADVFRGKYATALGAKRLIRRVTGGGTVAEVAEWCAARHGLAELAHPLCAQRGDLVTLANGDGREIAGIVGLSGRELVAVGEGGLVSVSIGCVKRAWRV